MIADRLRCRAGPASRHRHQQPAVAGELSDRSWPPRRTSRRCRSATTRSSATTSRSPTRTKKRPPATWTRKQTINNAERYITPELKEFESEALGARDKAIALEQSLFEQVRQALLPHVNAFQELAYGLARVDVLASLATLAQERRYCRPERRRRAHARNHRWPHPVLEQQLGSEFVANDVKFRASRFAAADHRPEHGRQIDLHPPGGADHAAGADRQLRARRRARRSAWSIASSRASAPATSCTPGNRPSWSR